MTGIMIGQAGAAAAGQETGGLLLLDTSIESFILSPTIFKALTSFRAKTDGVAQKASGSTQSLLSYVDLSSDQYHTSHPITGADYEIYFDSLTNAATGSSGSWFGSSRDVFLDLGTQRTWTWEKDTSSVGAAVHGILIEIRNIAMPANTTGVKTFTFISAVDL